MRGPRRLGDTPLFVATGSGFSGVPLVADPIVIEAAMVRCGGAGNWLSRLRRVSQLRWLLRRVRMVVVVVAQVNAANELLEFG